MGNYESSKKKSDDQCDTGAAWPTGSIGDSTKKYAVFTTANLPWAATDYPTPEPTQATPPPYTYDWCWPNQHCDSDGRRRRGCPCYPAGDDSCADNCDGGPTTEGQISHRRRSRL